jgi:hypothetical protein
MVKEGETDTQRKAMLISQHDEKKCFIQIYRLCLIVQDSNELRSGMCIRFETE